MNKKNTPSKILLLDAGIYSAEAARLAAFVLSGRAAVGISRSGAALRAEISSADPETSAGEFLNEALNQQCRMDLAARNGRLAGMIVSRALLAAAGAGGHGRGKKK